MRSSIIGYFLLSIFALLSNSAAVRAVPFPERTALDKRFCSRMVCRNAVVQTNVDPAATLMNGLIDALSMYKSAIAAQTSQSNPVDVTEPPIISGDAEPDAALELLEKPAQNSYSEDDSTEEDSPDLDA